MQYLQKEFLRVKEHLKKIPEEIMTFEDWLQYIHMSEEQYVDILCSSLKRPKVFMKRSPQDININPYMKGLLHAWQASHDVQFVLDPYQCVTYVCDYMTKGHKGMSEVLHAACEEAKAGNMDLKNSVQHMGNKLLNATECSAQEACWDILQMSMTNSSRKKEFICMTTKD